MHSKRHTRPKGVSTTSLVCSRALTARSLLVGGPSPPLQKQAMQGLHSATQLSQLHDRHCGRLLCFMTSERLLTHAESSAALKTGSAYWLEARVSWPLCGNITFPPHGL